ncbi:chemotaxis protein CheX [Aminipila butyrica]|uniref:Chemotaxis protein CheX n=1 Tax=Aminipila butyrica TaxID=433296 RepID=A0A858BS21_9FIRM|nr:chemotaxis protein CheX [Aminipila butyrica]QIB68751.1 chemotaxis protein CheX [Aminipila butyrica]
MNTDLYAPFLEATRSVFQLMLDLSDIEDRPSDTFPDSDETLDIAIGVIGDLTGEVIYRFPVTTSVNIVNIMSGMEVDSVDEFVTSAIFEIANIISGNVLTTLSGNDLACDILPPVQRAGDDSKSYEIKMACCLSTSAGDVCLDIRLNPSKG